MDVKSAHTVDVRLKPKTALYATQRRMRAAAAAISLPTGSLRSHEYGAVRRGAVQCSARLRSTEDFAAVALSGLVYSREQTVT